MLLIALKKNNMKKPIDAENFMSFFEETTKLAHEMGAL